jgi:hypothetical protein
VKTPECIDCIAEGVTTYRPAPYGGPRSRRCTTHNRAWLKRNKDRAHARHIEANFGITADEYWALHQAQGGKCWICRIATGRARKLAVDHDHRSSVVRGLLCSPCNVMIGRLGPDAFVRVLEYLYNPPAIKVIGCRLVLSMDATENAGMSGPAGAKLTITGGGEPEA